VALILSAYERAFFLIRPLIGGQTAQFGMEWIVTWYVGAPSWERLKADNTEGGHVGRPNERRARIGHAPWTEMTGAGPGHHDASPLMCACQM
jgi:hypothetical protein